MRSLFTSLALLAGTAFAQGMPAPVAGGSGPLIVIKGSGEVKQANDEARIVFMVEEQDRDKAVAASRVNEKTRRGTELLRRADADAILSTRAYSSLPIYAEPPVRTQGQGVASRQLLGWRVSQRLEFRTRKLQNLGQLVASAQSVMAVNAAEFGLSDDAQRALDQKRIEAAWRNLQERMAFVAGAMGRSQSEVMLDLVDFDATGEYAPEAAAPRTMSLRSGERHPVEEPSFEPGETTLQMRVVGRFRLREAPRK